MKSIKMKILLSMALTVFLSLCAVGGSGIYLNYSSMIGTMNQTMTELARTASQRVSKELDIYKNIAYEVGIIDRLSSSGTSVEDKKNHHRPESQGPRLSAWKHSWSRRSQHI
ncbi:MAG: hypothetical protein LBS02_01160 [Hungatella sp.]|jgi:methyl-accepting chemotaxis protein|nr:hypothetical protein [Hungatella sp.]